MHNLSLDYLLFSAPLFFRVATDHMATGCTATRIKKILHNVIGKRKIVLCNLKGKTSMQKSPNMLTKQFVFTNSNSNSFIGTNSSTGYGYSPITGYLKLPKCLGITEMAFKVTEMPNGKTQWPGIRCYFSENFMKIG